jgi:hypothetical protein
MQAKGKWEKEHTIRTRCWFNGLHMWPCKWKLHEEKSKCASLAQQNGFGPAVLCSLLRLVKGAPKAPGVDWLIVWLVQVGFYQKTCVARLLVTMAKPRRKSVQRKKACGKALVDMAKAHCYQSRELWRASLAKKCWEQGCNGLLYNQVLTGFHCNLQTKIL